MNYYDNYCDITVTITATDYFPNNPQKQAKVKEYERQIDQLVYKLCESTLVEIRIVENYGR